MVRDGFKASIIGFIGGIIIGILIILIAKWYALNYMGKRLDTYFLVLLGGLGSLLGYISTMTINFVLNSLKEMKIDLSLKADIKYIDDKLKDAKAEFDDHKKINENQFKFIQDLLISIDRKV